MSINDPIADMLTRIRNSNLIKKEVADVSCSKMALAIASVMKDQGYISGFKEIQDNLKKTLRIYLKYGPMKERVITNMKRESKPGRRVYKKVDEIRRVLGGMGIAIYSTSKGVLTNAECRKARVGGELLCTIW